MRLHTLVCQLLETTTNDLQNDDEEDEDWPGEHRLQLLVVAHEVSIERENGVAQREDALPERAVASAVLAADHFRDCQTRSQIPPDVLQLVKEDYLTDNI